MRAGTWADVWNLILELLNRESVPIRIAAALAAAFAFVMVLEGLRASFFPRRITERIAAIELPREKARNEHLLGWEEGPHSTVFDDAAGLSMVNRDVLYRSSPQQARVLRARKPSE